VRIGIAGVGNWGRLHLETLAGLHGVHLAAICDPDADRRAGAVDAARRIGAGRAAASAPDDARAFDSFEACLREADLDGIVVATKDEQHTPHAVAALERGWHVFVEKPLAISLRDARAVHEAAARAGRVAMVGTILRFSVPHRQLADAVHLDRLGGLLHVRCVRYVTMG
jgi:predicted dehydrogenase